MLRLHKIIRAPHVVSCPIVSILFFFKSCQRGVFKVMEKDFS